MRILLLAQFYPPVIGGEERHVRNLAVALAARGLDVHVATLGTDRGEPQHDRGVTVHVLEHVGSRIPALYPTADRPLALPVPDPLTTRGLQRLVADLRPDVVHAHNWIVSSWTALPAAYRTAPRSSTPSTTPPTSAPPRRSGARPPRARARARAAACRARGSTTAPAAAR